ncbi:MAG: hypothetical protein U9R34_03690 [Nanoarchaeota archaeon]|nr:hypothetical protein [Nanoarchaeota archaeon]
MNKNKQDYTFSEILVGFRQQIDCNDSFAEKFGKGLGYDLVGDWKYGDNVYIYQVPKDAETEACERFRFKKEFVEWAETKDVKIEKRWESLEEAIDKLDSLHNDAEINDKKYAERLDIIIEYIKSIKPNFDT